MPKKNRIKGRLRISSHGCGSGNPPITYQSDGSFPWNMVFELTRPYEYRPGVFCKFIEVNAYLLWPPANVSYPLDQVPVGFVVQAFPLKEDLRKPQPYKGKSKMNPYAQYARLDFVPEWVHVTRADTTSEGANQSPWWNEPGMLSILKGWGMDFINYDSFSSEWR